MNIMFLNVLTPVWLFVALTYACPVQRDLQLMRAKRDAEVEENPDCFQKGLCRMDALFYRKMCKWPLVGPFLKFFLSEEHQKQTYFVVCLLSGLLALFAVRFRHRSQCPEEEAKS